MTAIRTGLHRKKVMLVDDHPVVRQGLAQLIESEPGLSVCCQASGVSEAVRIIHDGTPDVAVVDLTLPDGSGLSLVEQMHAYLPDMPILVLSMHDETVYAERCIKAGARGYIMKKEPPEKVIQAIRQVLSGEISLGPAVASRILNRHRPPHRDPVEKLSNRELEVFQMMGQGTGTRDIASKLGLSTKTVETHLEHIKKKLELQSGREVVVRAVDWVRKGQGI